MKPWLKKLIGWSVVAVVTALFVMIVLLEHHVFAASAKTADEIDTIVKESWQSGRISEKHVLDLQEKRYTKMTYDYLNENSLEEPIPVSCTEKALNKREIDDFMKELEKTGFLDRKVKYRSDRLSNYLWRITVNFKDKSQISMHSNMNIPETWDDIGGAFQRLTGETWL